MAEVTKLDPIDQIIEDAVNGTDDPTLSTLKMLGEIANGLMFIGFQLSDLNDFARGTDETVKH